MNDPPQAPPPVGDVRTFLSALGSTVSHSDYGSFSARRITSIAISVGYLGLPAVALSILSGNALRALNHLGARLETALLMAWRTRRTAVSFGRRWLTNSPLARRWNQRVYRAVWPRHLAQHAAASTAATVIGRVADGHVIRIRPHAPCVSREREGAEEGHCPARRFQAGVRLSPGLMPLPLRPPRQTWISAGRRSTHDRQIKTQAKALWPLRQCAFLR